MFLIGIAGAAGSGKDTVADYLVANYGFEKISFAKILKDMLAVAGLGEPVNRDDKEKNFPGLDFSFRHAAQTLGTEWGRECIDPDIWVKLTLRNLVQDGKYVISDVRFENEAKAARDGGFLLHIEGRGVDLGNLGKHFSEAGIVRKDYDPVIANTCTKASLYVRIDDIMKNVLCATYRQAPKTQG